MRRIAIRLLGPFEVTIDGEVVTTFDYAKVRALLAYLAVESHRPLPRARLAALLWPDQPDRTARSNLSQALTTLRTALGDKTAERPVLLTDAQSIQLDPCGAVEVDVMQFLALLHDSDAHAHHSWRTCMLCADRLRRAVDLYRGNFLADFYIPDSAVFEEWAALQREHLVQRALSALSRLAERAEWRGAYTEAVSYVRRQVAMEPLIEASQRALMRLLALNGERTAALAQYRQLQSMLAHELAVEPEEATRAVFDQIRRGDSAGLQPPQAPFVVPAPPTPLVGRAQELQAIRALLQEAGMRALTIIGTGGVGKTRLAIEAAHVLRYDFEDGIYFVELASLNDAALVADALAQVLGVKERPGQSIVETLRGHLRAKHLLLVLDNFEHVSNAAPLVSELLAACPALRVVVTSREPLSIRAEQQFALEPLADADAVQLFVQRAQAAGAGLAADETNTSIYTAICRRLDRLPLAIELIAVRARTLSPIDLLRQLDRPLQVLVRGPRDVPLRHQALRNAIQWSYDLLDSEEQHVFAKFGVFAGGWTPEAAQAVLGESIAVLPVLEALHRASLVYKQVIADETRFLMLETIREFALEQLEASGEAEAAHRQHAGYFARFSMAVYEELLRAEAPGWSRRVAAEQDNLRAAFGWALSHQAYETALRIATGVWRFHWMRGLLREGLDRLKTALMYRDEAPWEVQSNALRAAGTLAIGLSDFVGARHWLEAAVEAGRRLDDPRLLQPALTNLGYALLEQGDLEGARSHLEESLALARRAQDPNTVKFPLGMLASLHLRLGNHAQALAMCEESLRINRACRDTEGTADALRVLAQIVDARGDTLRARQLGEAALALHRSLNHQLGMGLDYALFGDLACKQGDDAGALEQYQRCLSLWRERENTVNSAAVLDRVAQILSRLGDSVRGATLLGAAAAIREQAGARLAANEQASRDDTIQACRLALGEAAFADAWATGRLLTPAQAIGLALEPTARGCPATPLAA
jgi:predicted ATPase/DNA-binding SARP family transcriptional activator